MKRGNRFSKVPSVARSRLRTLRQVKENLGINATSNSNGYYRVNGNFLECYHTLEISFISTSTLGATWTFPVEFSSAPYVFITLDETSMTPTVFDLSMIRVINVSTSSAAIRLHRQTGATNFVGGDTANVYVQAIGLA